MEAPPTRSGMNKFAPKPRLLVPVARRVLRHVSDRTGVSIERMQGDTRGRDEIVARRRAARLFYRLGYGLPDIGIAMQRHHTTILHHVRWRTR